MIELQGVVKRYGDHVAVDHVDLSCKAGQTHVLIGPSGCGKSTLLRMMVGLVTPDTGEVRVAGEALTAATIPQLRRRIGYMIQEGGLFPHLSAFDNVALLPRYLRWPAKKIAQRIDELRELTHLPPTLLQRFPRQLSGGQRQRVSLMRALMLDPDVLLLDEPLGDLDPMIRAELQQDLKDVFAELHKTVVLVTHDLAEAHFLGYRITLLQAGRIIQQGALAELIHHPADEFVSRFVRAQRQLAS
jgi:osmoprotectant transport system ATP-binding protein